MPFGPMILKKLEEVGKLGLEIDMIAPDHGIIWRANHARVLDLYRRMASGGADCSVAIIYDTMWHSTELMTVPIASGVRDEGLDVKVMKLRATPMSIAIKEFWKCRGTLIGSPTLNNILYPSVAELLTHLRGLRPKNRIAGAFGSYGWSGGAVKEANEEFKRMGLEIYEPGLQLLYKPSLEDEEACYEFGREFARRVRDYHRQFESAAA
jgi:flavorubredoxin